MNEFSFDFFRAEFERYRVDHPVGTAPKGLYDPAMHLFGLGGKRQRPVLTLAACALCGGDYRKALPAALAIETFHTFSLVHDDIMDAAPLRRGQPTVHAQWGIASAILSGDALLVEAYRLLALSPESVLKPVLDSFNQMGRRLCEGQQLDMDSEADAIDAEKAYFDMIEAKTGVLIGCALEIGALIGGASPERASAFKAFGIELGIAFQLMDDWLDCFGSQDLIGKEIGGDLREGKRTWLMIQLEALSPESYHALIRLESAERVEKGLELLRAYHLDSGLRLLAEDWLKLALNRLDQTGLDALQSAPLREFALQLVHRSR